MSARERAAAFLGLLWTSYRRTWRGDVISRFASPLFFLLSMGLGLGALVDERAGGVQGQSYLHFVVPGIVATQAMWLAMGEATYPVYARIVWDRSYEAALASPLGVRDILRATVVMLAVHLSGATTVFMAIAALFGGFESLWGLACLPVAVLTGLAFGTPLLAYTASLQSDAGLNLVFRVVMTPLMLFSGTFFPVAQLPAWMQPLAWLTPLWHGVDASRSLAAGVSDPGRLAMHLAVLAAFAAVGWVLAGWSFQRRLIT